MEIDTLFLTFKLRQTGAIQTSYDFRSLIDNEIENLVAFVL